MLIVAGLLVLALVLYLYFNNRIIEYKDTEIPQIETVYTDLKKDLVHGDLLGTIESSKSFEGRSIFFCKISEGVIIKQGGRFYLDCPKAKVKEVKIQADNTFTVRLLSGTYFANLQFETGETSSDLPLRVNVHKDELATFNIFVSTE